MAITYGRNVIVLGAASDAEGTGESGNFNHPLFIKSIKVDTGDGGNVLINEGTGGARLVKLDSTTANTTIEVRLDHFVSAIDAATLPANASLEIHLGVPGA
jgi:hypothetical protein